MAIKNFVNFITNTIHPEVIEEYRNSTEYSVDDFFGYDTSTGDFTKAGWMMVCRDNAVKAGTLTTDRDNAVRDILYIEKDGLKNRDVVSPAGYNLLQQWIYHNRRSTTLNLNLSYPDFGNFVKEKLLEKSDDLKQSGMEMLIEYSMHDTINTIIPRDLELGTASTDETVSRTISPFMFALKKKAEEIVAGDGADIASRTFDEVYTHISNLTSTYDGFYFRNAIGTESRLSPKNEIARYISITSHAELEATVDDLISKGFVEATETSKIAQALTHAVVSATGLSITKVDFSIDRYLSKAGDVSANRGYNPLFYYIYKYGQDSNPVILTKLGNVFSPFALTSVSGTNDGYTALGLLTYVMEIDGDDWAKPNLATYIKEQINVANGDNAYERAAWLTNVRDVKKSGSNNFGPINNIMSKINNHHSSWWATVSAEEDNTLTPDDYNSTYTTLANKIMHPDFNFSFYKTWMFENGKEIE